MSYVQKHLQEGEVVVYSTKLSWVEYLKAISVGIIGLIFAISGHFVGLILAAVLAVFAYLKISSSEFAVTNKRIIIKVGIISSHSLETMLNKIESINVSQGLLDKIFKCGTLVVRGTGGTNNPFPNVDNPFEFRNAINKQLGS